SGHVRQLKVQNHQRRQILAKLAQGRKPIVGDAHGIAGRDQVNPVRNGDGTIVFDDEDTIDVGHRLSPDVVGSPSAPTGRLLTTRWSLAGYASWFAPVRIACNVPGSGKRRGGAR